MIMEIIEFLILFPFALGSGNKHIQTVDLSTKQTWYEASVDSSCLLVGLNNEGDLDENIGNLVDVNLGSVTTAWIGGHAKRVWVNFEGCYFGIFTHNISGRAQSSHEDPAKQCLLYCNYGRFVLTSDRCICYEEVKETFGGCLAGNCSNENYAYCGYGTNTYTPNLVKYCMCHFRLENDSTLISGEGNCLSVEFKPHQEFVARKCNQKHGSLCFVPYSNGSYPIESAYDWMHSLLECYNHNKQFVNRKTRLIGVHNGTYWIGAFAMAYNLWGRPTNTSDGCLAISLTQDRIIPVVLPCNTLLHSVCTKITSSSQTTTLPSIYRSIGTSGYLPSVDEASTIPTNESSTIKTNESSTISINDSATISSNELSTVTINEPGNTTSTNTLDVYNTSTDVTSGKPYKSPVPVIVGSAVGGVVCVVAVVAFVLYLRRHGKLPKENISVSSKFSSPHYAENTNVYDYVDDGGQRESHIYTEPKRDDEMLYVNGAYLKHQQDLVQQRSKDSTYCGLTRHSIEEHMYGRLDVANAK